jgi:hypothetical protein
MVQPASALSTPLLRDSGCPEDERRVLALTVSPSVEESIAEDSTSWVGTKNDPSVEVSRGRTRPGACDKC